MKRRRGFVIIAVLVITGVAILVATGLLYRLQSEVAGAQVARERDRSRALAWSGVEIVLAQLSDQRAAILEGQEPVLEETYEIELGAGQIGEVRLLPMNGAGDLVVPEAARLDLNAVTLEELDVLVGPDLADAIVAERDARGLFGSVAELLAVEGMTPARLYGPLDEINVMDAAQRIDFGLGARIADRLGEGGGGLADRFTVFAAEPNLQRSGDQRINLSIGWSEELGRRLDRRFGQGTGAGMKTLFERGDAFTKDSDIYGLLLEFGVDADDWDDVDGVTTQGEVILGRLDVNRASAEVLACLPELEPAVAEQIVRARTGLPAAELDAVGWLAREGLVELEAYRTLADRITTRSWTWRARVAAGTIAPGAEADAPLENPVIYEVVIDLVDPGARLAFVRDITLLQTTARLAEGAFDEDEAGDTFDPAATREREPEPGDEALPLGDSPDEPDPSDGPEATEPPPGFGDLSFGGGFEGTETPEVDRDSGVPDDTDVRDGSPERSSGAPSARRLGRWWRDSARNAGGSSR